MIDVNDMVADATKPNTVLGSVLGVDAASKSACIVLNSGGMAVWPLDSLTHYFAQGWYRMPQTPFIPGGVVTVVYRGMVGDYPEYTVPVNVSDA